MRSFMCKKQMDRLEIANLWRSNSKYRMIVNFHKLKVSVRASGSWYYRSAWHSSDIASSSKCQNKCRVLCKLALKPLFSVYLLVCIRIKWTKNFCILPLCHPEHQLSGQDERGVGCLIYQQRGQYFRNIRRKTAWYFVFVFFESDTLKEKSWNI